MNLADGTLRWMTLTIASFVFCLSACSNADDKKLPPNGRLTASEVSAIVEKLPAADRQVFERWSLRMHRNELFGGEASAPSVRQALLNQIEYERIKADETATETARAAEAERQMQLKRDREQQAAEDLARIAVRRQAVHMEIAKRFDGKVVNYEARGIFNPRGIPTGRVWIFTLRFKNRSNKPAVGIAGWINITDVFGNDLGSYPFALEPAIEPNGNLDYDAYMEYDSRDARHRAMAAVNRIHYQWFFESIVYRDGTRIDYKTITDSDPGRAGPQKSPARTPTT